MNTLYFISLKHWHKKQSLTTVTVAFVTTTNYCCMKFESVPQGFIISFEQLVTVKTHP